MTSGASADADKSDDDNDDDALSNECGGEEHRWSMSFSLGEDRQWGCHHRSWEGGVLPLAEEDSVLGGLIGGRRNKKLKHHYVLRVFSSHGGCFLVWTAKRDPQFSAIVAQACKIRMQLRH